MSNTLPVIRKPGWGLTLLVTLLLTCVVHAQGKSENIYFELPPGFEEAFEDGDESFFIQEWVPKGKQSTTGARC